MNVSIEGSTYPITIPNICPYCHVVNNPKLVWHTTSREMDKKLIWLSAWVCANNDCSRTFIAQFHYGGGTFHFSRFLTGYPKGPNWPKPITELKSGSTKSTDGNSESRFIKTYLQSLNAENNGLDEIAGMGYRKSIEYLVKDWAIQNNPEEKETVEKLWLGQVISKYYDGDLKEILERATWLGNDHSHYNKLFEDFVINDLKELIELIMVELDRQFKKKHYIENIQSKK